jgi:hypothetical protein
MRGGKIIPAGDGLYCRQNDPTQLFIRPQNGDGKRLRAYLPVVDRKQGLAMLAEAAQIVAAGRLVEVAWAELLPPRRERRSGRSVPKTVRQVFASWLDSTTT